MNRVYSRLRLTSFVGSWLGAAPGPVEARSLSSSFLVVVLTTVLSAVVVAVMAAFTVGRTSTISASLACFAFVQIAILSLPFLQRASVSCWTVVLKLAVVMDTFGSISIL